GRGEQWFVPRLGDVCAPELLRAPPGPAQLGPSQLRGFSRRRLCGHDRSALSGGRRELPSCDPGGGRRGTDPSSASVLSRAAHGRLSADKAAAVDHVHQVRRRGARGGSPKGAAGTIERDRPALCVEVTGDPGAGGSSSHRIVSSLGRWGYEPFWLDAGRLVRRRAGDRSVNYFFLTDAHRARLAARGLLAA